MINHHVVVTFLGPDLSINFRSLDLKDNESFFVELTTPITVSYVKVEAFQTCIPDPIEDEQSEEDS